MDITILPSARYEAALAFIISEGFCTLQVHAAEECDFGSVPFEAVFAGIVDAATRHPALEETATFITSVIGWDGQECSEHPAAHVLSKMFDSAATDTRLYQNSGHRWMDLIIVHLDRSVKCARSRGEAAMFTSAPLAIK